MLIIEEHFTDRIPSSNRLLNLWIQSLGRYISFYRLPSP